MISGAVNAGVPQNVKVCLAVPSCLLTPKSISLTCPPLPSITLSGFRSLLRVSDADVVEGRHRKMMLCLCRNHSARQISTT